LYLGPTVQPTVLTMSRETTSNALFKPSLVALDWLTLLPSDGLEKNRIMNSLISVSELGVREEERHL
jgi:hypothetical protein